MERKITILVTDDDEDDREFISDAFISKGLEDSIQQFANGKELVDFLNQTQEIDDCIVLLDLNMPIKDGYQALKEIKENDRLKTIPVIMLTTSASSFDQDRCKKLGCKEYILKPFSFTVYEQIADQVLKIFDNH
jgi:CheY-like chemotaxis protein